MKAQRINFNTQDGVTIAGLHLHVPAAKSTALLVHMMPATKESWLSFMPLLAERGVSSLAIDLRGHGDSLMMGNQPIDYHRFDDDEHAKATLDVEAAVAWLLDAEKLPIHKLLMAGASIGANLGLWFASTHLQVPAVLALSPGLNYRSLMPENYIPALAENQRAFLAASEEDAYSYSSLEEFSKMKTEARITIKKLRAAGHGTTMFASDQNFMKESADWLCAGL